MCAAALARPLPLYEGDTIIVDVDEQEHEEPEVQVLLASPTGGACWHKRACAPFDVLADHTACGRQYDYRFEQLELRRGRYEGELCTVCFTTWELSKSKELAEQAQRLREEARKDRDR